MSLERGRPEELFPHEQAQLQVEGNPRWAIGSWAQTIRHMLGRDASPVVITAEQPAEFSPENAIYKHLLGVRDNYAHISTQRRGAGDYLDLDDTELRTCIPSYQMLSVELEQAHGGSDLLEMGNTRTVLSQQGKDLAAQLVENFMTRIKGSEEYDLPSLFSHQLKLMYVGLKHDPDHTDINTNVMQRIFTSARAQFRRRMAEEARAQAHAQAVAEEAAQRAREAAATATRSRPSRLRRGLELAGAGSLMTAGLALLAQAGMIWAEGVANRLPVKPPREPQPITRSVDAYGDERHICNFL